MKGGIIVVNLEENSICQYLMLVAVDHDGASYPNAKDHIDYIIWDSRATEIIFILNPVEDQAIFSICHVWYRMAEV